MKNISVIAKLNNCFSVDFLRRTICLSEPGLDQTSNVNHPFV